ncbi:MAG: ribonuclease domain-containing protein [Methanobacteriaceae archaeon]|nr:ribonuclease domain-containing protein [Methanobacteriaceae archaeon]
MTKFNKLPNNYITKKEARSLGWTGGSLEPYAPGKSIGGDIFTNREKVLPSASKYIECDIDTNGSDSRGAKRIVYSEDKKIYYTNDHYKTFKQIN